MLNVSIMNLNFIKYKLYPASADIISLCIDLLKSRVDWLKQEQTHALVQTIIIPLVERSSSNKVLQAIVVLTHELCKSASKV